MRFQNVAQNDGWRPPCSQGEQMMTIHIVARNIVNEATLRAGAVAAGDLLAFAERYRRAVDDLVGSVRKYNHEQVRAIVRRLTAKRFKDTII